jgi:hypothetical protein
MRRSLVIVFAALLVVAVPSAASAEVQPRDHSLVVMTGDAVVPADETVDAVVVFDGSATVQGHVRQAVVVFQGPVTISGAVEGDVVLFDGTLTVQDGARIGGDVFADRRLIAPGATIGGTAQSTANIASVSGWASLAIGLAVWLAIVVSMLILGVLLLWFAPRAADAVVTAGTTAVGASIGWGAAAFFGLPIAGVIAIVTLVGIPLGIGILLGLGLIFAIGHVAGALLLGRLIVKKGSRVAAFALGWAIVGALLLIPGLGGLVSFAATLYGLGAICVAAFRARRQAQRPAEEPPSVPAMPVRV